MVLVGHGSAARAHPATTTPSTTAVTRSSTIVARAVAANTTASLRVVRSRAPMLDTSTIRTAVARSTPASAASGIVATTGAESEYHPDQHGGVRHGRQPGPGTGAHVHRGPGDRRRAGIPPNRGAARFAMPWPNSSRSESCRSPALIESATVAESKLSNAASAATANAGTIRTRTIVGVHRGQRSAAAARTGRSPIEGHRQVQHLRDDGRQHDPDQRQRDRRLHAGLPTSMSAMTPPLRAAAHLRVR